MGAAAFAEGATTGVSLRLLESQGADADVLEVVGGERLRLCDEWPRRARGGGDPDSKDSIRAIGAVLERSRVRVRGLGGDAKSREN